MNWILLAFWCILAISIALIIVTLASLPQLGDERKKFIKMKAQSYTFAVIVVYMLIEIVKSAYLNLQTENTYEGVNPFTFLIVFSIGYLISLLFFKKKYGG